MALNAINTPKILTGKRTIGEVSLDSKAIYGVLSETQVGAFATYEQLSGVIGRDVHVVWGSVVTAQRMALREMGAIFSAVRGVGLKRLNNSEIAALPGVTITRVRRAVGREMRRQAIVDESLLTSQERMFRHTRLSMLGALTEFTKPSTAKLIEAAKPVDSLPVGKVLELFRLS